MSEKRIRKAISCIKIAEIADYCTASEIKSQLNSGGRSGCVGEQLQKGMKRGGNGCIHYIVVMDTWIHMSRTVKLCTFNMWESSVET